MSEDGQAEIEPVVAAELPVRVSNPAVRKTPSGGKRLAVPGGGKRLKTDKSAPKRHQRVVLRDCILGVTGYSPTHTSTHAPKKKLTHAYSFL